MKRIAAFREAVFISALIMILLCTPAIAAAQLTKIADNVYSYVDVRNGSKDNSFGANAGIVIGPDGIIVIDTLISSKEAKRFIKDIRAITDKPIRYVVNTHYHLDHAFGNSEFVKLGAVVIAQENDKKLMEKTAAGILKNIAQYGLNAEDMAGTVPSYPTITYGDRMTIDLGGQQVELIHARYAHTSSDTLVYLRDKKIVFAGDILFTNYHPFLGEGDINEWANELDEIRAMDFDKMIPGHGPLSGKKDVEDMKAYILLFDRTAKELASQSHDVQAISAELKKILPPRPEGSFLIPKTVEMKYVRKDR
jgi:cyclase